MLIAWLRSLAPWRAQLWFAWLLLLLQLGATLGLVPLARRLEGILSAFALVPFWQLLAAICGLFALRNLLDYGFSLLAGRIAAAWAIGLRRQAYAALLQADWRSLQALDPDDALSTLSDDLDKLRVAIQGLIQRLIPSLLLLGGLLACLLLISWQLSILLLGATPVAARAIAWLGRALSQHGGDQQSRLAGIIQELGETLRHALPIRLYAQQAAQTRRLDAAQQHWLASHRRTLAFAAAERPLLSTIQVLAIAGLLAFSGWLVARGVLDGGDLLAYATALGLAVDPGLWAAEAWGQLQLARPSWQRVAALIALPPQQPPLRIASADEQLRLEGIDLARSGRPVLKQAGLRLAIGEQAGLSGPSGAGKSTLLALIAGLEAPDSGSIALPASWLNAPDAIVLVPQRAALFNRSLRENLCLDRPCDEAELHAVLEACSLSERVRHLPEGLETPLGAHGGWLSGGERQRVALARALLRRPRCLLLDEATSEMDPALEAAVLARIRAAWPGMSWLVVSHRPGTLQQLGCVWHLEDGRLTRQENHSCPTPGTRP